MGGIGPKSADLLHSALYRQHVGAAGNPKWRTKYEVCATLIYGLIKNHAFHDANKRTAFLSMLVFLQKQKLIPSKHETIFEDFIVDIADDKLDKFAYFKDLRRKGSADPEVYMIADFLRKNTRKEENFSKSITYRELQSILKNFCYSYGICYELDNQDRSFIDVVKIERSKTLFGLGPARITRKRVGQIVFPGWTKEVARDTLRKVRKLTGLDSAHNVDSAAFFAGVDPVRSLVSSYQEPLRRLAYR